MDAAWCIDETGSDPQREAGAESRLTIGNGYLGVRGALDIPAAASQPDLFIAGVYDSQVADLEPTGRKLQSTPCPGDPYARLAPLPFPFRIRLSVEGRPLAIDSQVRRTLDMNSGVLHTSGVCDGPGSGSVTLHARRCASLADPHLLLQEVAVDAQGASGEIALEAQLDAPDLERSYRHLQRVELTGKPQLQLVRYRTRASGIEVCIASRTVREPRTLRRLISVFTSRDTPQPRAAALAHLETAARTAFADHLAQHAREWAAFWSRADMALPGDLDDQKALRFGSYHLKIAAAQDERVSIGARGLTGRGYDGHVFWDTEIFMLPFFMHVEPMQARRILLYRYATLDGARRHAREQGCAGACFAWESSVTGDDVTPRAVVLKSTGQEVPVLTGSQQVHVAADVAYGVWRYWEATRDEDFLAGAGSAILFETARFWASRIARESGQHHIRGVMGPDEYHLGVDDNAYTNHMARFNLERAAWAAQRLGNNRDEAREWSKLASALFCPGPRADGVIEQFAGFFALEDLSADDKADRSPQSRVSNWQRVNRLKLLKQPDVLMLPLLFPDAFPDEVVAANYRYYEPMTEHGSSLSPPVHAAIAARLGLADDAERYRQIALQFDFRDPARSRHGVHLGCMGATWLALMMSGVLAMRH